MTDEEKQTEKPKRITRCVGFSGNIEESDAKLRESMGDSDDSFGLHIHTPIAADDFLQPLQMMGRDFTKALMVHELNQYLRGIGYSLHCIDNCSEISIESYKRLAQVENDEEFKKGIGFCKALLAETAIVIKSNYEEVVNVLLDDAAKILEENREPSNPEGQPGDEPETPPLN